MKNRSLSNLILYVVFIMVICMTMYFSYSFFLRYNPNKNFGVGINQNDNNADIVTYTAIFDRNGATSIGTSSLSCNSKSSGCEITLPNILKEDGYVLGWNTENVNYAKYNVGEKVNLNSNQIFYAITYSENILTIADNNLDYLESNQLSCKVYNKENSCTVKIPNYNKKGYENRGYSLRNDSLTGIVFPNQTYLLKKDTVLYPIYNTLTRSQTLKISKTFNKYGIVIEVEEGCSSSVYNEYLNYLDNINNKAKYLLIGSKITFINSNTFDSLWGSNYMGMNYGPNPLRLVDVKCPVAFNSEYYPTMVHELAHTWDFYYSNYFEKNISDQNDYINLYSKYKNNSNRPFRDYSYSNIREFFADSVRYYYFKYIDPKIGYANLDYPKDIKDVLEKYICISKNNYSNIGC